MIKPAVGDSARAAAPAIPQAPSSPEPAPASTKRPRKESAPPFRGSVARAPAKPLFIIIVRGGVLRLGNRWSNNSDGDINETKDVLASIRDRVWGNASLTWKYTILVAVDIVCKDADSVQKQELEELIRTSLGFATVSDTFRIRISSENLGVAQADSLLVTCDWVKSVFQNSAAACGFLFLRADCFLKRMFDPSCWIQQGLAERKVVFPFRLWSDGGPVDQIFFVPSDLLPDLERSLKYLTTYAPNSLNRTSLHFLHTKKCIPGKLGYAVGAVCDPNSSKEWNPLYRITGRHEKRQSLKSEAKWGSFWFLEPEPTGQTGRV